MSGAEASGSRPRSAKSSGGSRDGRAAADLGRRCGVAGDDREQREDAGRTREAGAALEATEDRFWSRAVETVDIRSSDERS